MNDEDEFGFFELAESIWADADSQRSKLRRKHGKDLGNWLADIRQYGAAWQGDAWQMEARRAENHVAFATVDDWEFWDRKPMGTFITSCHISVRFNSETGSTDDSSTSMTRAAEYSIAGGRLVG